MTRLAALALALLLPVAAFAAEEAKDDALPNFEITLKKHEFTPMELVVPADKKFQITVKNDSQQPIEFESHQLKREKIVQSGKSIVIKFNELKAGTYKYVDDFNEASIGYITAK